MNGQGEHRRIVTLWDPAIRWAETGQDGGTSVTEYSRGERKESDLRIYDGAKPRYFVVRRLKRSEMVAIDDLYGDSTKRAAAFAMGVVSADRPQGLIKPSHSRWTSEELDEYFEHSEVEDVGAYVYATSRIPLGLPVSYALPPSSVDAWAALASRFVAQSRADAVPSSSEPEGR